MNRMKLPLPPFVVFGAPDPEAEEAEKFCRKLGIPVGYAVGEDGKRVSPSTAYAGSNTAQLPDGHDCSLMAVPHAILFECAAIVNAAQITRCDHHRPGDPGYGCPPAEYWQASSLGQLVEMVRGEYFGAAHQLPTPQMRMVAAADHCLAAAYRGECPGVDPEALAHWRAESRATFQKRPVEAVIADVAAARIALLNAPQICVRCGQLCQAALPGEPIECGVCAAPQLVVPLGDTTVPELPEAAVRLGVAYEATVTERDGRRKLVLGGHTTPELVGLWIDVHRALDRKTYGDPARGFAGAYLS